MPRKRNKCPLGRAGEEDWAWGLVRWVDPRKMGPQASWFSSTNSSDPNVTTNKTAARRTLCIQVAFRVSLGCQHLDPSDSTVRRLLTTHHRP